MGFYSAKNNNQLTIQIMTTLFLHGLDSSSKGTKARYFRDKFPDMVIPDFDGSLEYRLQQLEADCKDFDNLIVIGSSFGGLMATCFAAENPERVKKLILLAPALNFPGFLVPHEKISAPTFLLIGKHDTVTPADDVLPLAERTFSHLQTHVVEDDHLLHHIFPTLNWQQLILE